MPLISCENLGVKYNKEYVFKDFNFAINQGEMVAITGESGAGKTTFLKSLIGLIPKNSMEGEIENKLILGDELTVIFQNHKSMLNPVMKVSKQVYEPLIVHKKMKKKQALEEAKKMFEQLNLDSSVLNKYPHELSGGMGQRVGIAMALITSPKLIIADEPTSSLDDITKKEILDLLIKMNQQGTAILFSTHDNKTAKIAKRTIDFSEKRVVQFQPNNQGVEGEELLRLNNISLKIKEKYILKNINLQLNRGECLAVVGSSGSGKTTLAKLIMGLYELREGNIHKKNIKIHYVMQDSYTSLNPYQKIKDIFMETGNENIEKVIQKFHFKKEFLEKYPSSLSGGERQLVAIIRGVLTNSDVIIFDESFSNLDDERKKIVYSNLKELNSKKGFIMIIHDRETIGKLCNRIVEI